MGAWLGFVSYDDEPDDSNGFDLGVNVGARFVFSEKHGIELYGRFGFLEQETNVSWSYSISSWKVSQPASVGIRYTYTF